ncbi:unnamed protein product [Cuscuta campestris]|uniref:CCHC-type domain-containing protein n=1 Tax=Cuscuta campestris TaxID=132261 RepID=A0A484M5J7_9ASTE|nr:unnamed protein product [Cuscuta campestris]
MAAAYVPPPPPPPPLVAVVTIEKLWKNGAEEFLGDQIADPMIAKRWFERTIRVLGNLRVPQEQHGDLVVALLQDSAYDWWKRVGAGVPEPVQWATFDRLFHEEYIPEHFVEAKREEFLKFTQGELTLPEYRQKFDELAGFGQDLVPTVEKRCKLFVEGLRPDLSTHLIIAPRSDINALYKNALDLNAVLIKKSKYEQTRGASTAPSRPLPPQKAGTSSKRSFAAPSSSPQSKKVKSAPAQSSASVQKKGKSGDGFHNPICEHCGRRHPGECWYTLGLCLGCGQVGHFRKDCPKNPGKAFSTAPAAPAPAGQPAQSQKSAAASSQPKRQHLGHRQGRPWPVLTRCESVPSSQPMTSSWTIRYSCPTHWDTVYDSPMCMDWLTANQAVVDCGAHTIRLRAEDGSDVLIHGKANVVADALSRKTLAVLHVQPTLQQQIASAQSSDDFCIHTVELVSRGEKPDFAVREADTVTLDENLTYEEEPVEILACEVRQLRNKTIPLVKVLWRSHTVEEATWETEESMRTRYPHLFRGQ